jgi:molecular chaperone DnaK
VSTRGAAAAASVGLDLGWSTLRAALAREEAVQPLLLDGSAWPLMVAVQGGSLVAGAEAVRAGAQGAPSARGLAMLLGASLEDASVRAWRRREAFSVEAGESGLRVRSGRAALDPVELVTGLLAEVRAAASREAGGEVRRAALAVPPGLLPRRRRALREAAEAAGFEVVRLVPAPAAALLAHHGPFGHRRVLVFDFGEGSCAATVVEQSGNALEVVGHAGDAELGGVELDLALVDALLTQFEKESGLLVPEDPAVFVRVRDEAARTKIALGDTTELEVQLRDLVPAGLSRADLYQRVPRARLLTLAAPLLDRALALCRIALAAGSFGGADLDEILISGGQGRLPAMVHMLAEKLGKEPVRPERPEWLAATGAALLCEGERRAGRYRTTSVAGASLGVVGRGGALRRVIDRSQPLPVERSYTAVTTTDGETRLELPIFVGDEPRAADNDCEGTVLVGPLPPAPRGEVRIAVKLALSESGELTVRARNAATGRELPCVLGPGRAARDG